MKKPSSNGQKNLKSWVFQKFTFDFIEKKDRETGFMQRKRKLDPVLLIFSLIFGVSSYLKPTLEKIHRHYVDLDDNPKIETSICNQSFRKRFNYKLVDFLKSLMDNYIDQIVHQSPAHLKGIVEDFKDILVQDSSIIRISKKFYDLHPAAGSRDDSAGLKIHAVYSVVYHSVKNAIITTERVHDSKMLKIGPDVENILLINDLRYYSLKTFSKIQEYGGFFVSRVKSNAVFKVVSINSGPPEITSIVDHNCFKSINGDDFLDRCYAVNFYYI